MSAIERRVVAAPMELRASESEAGKSTMSGIAAVFSVVTDIAGMFREQIAPGAFATAIKEDDVRALFNHDPNYVIGRTTSGTLRLSEDEVGLRYDVDPPNTSWANDLMVTIGRGDVSQSSFGFQVVREEWTKPENRAELPTRTILEARLFDVSPVTYPAYASTTVSAEARSQAEAITTAAVALSASEPVDDEQKAHDAMLIRQKRQAIVEGEL